MEISTDCDAGGRIGVRAAEAVRRAARVPAGGVVAAARGREGEEGARVGVVDREAPARARLRVVRVVLRAHVDGVGAVGGEARRCEAVRPVAAGERRGLEDLAAAGERGAVPVVAGALADGDLDRLHAGGRVGVRAAEAVRGATRVPSRVRVVAARGREGEERARVRRVVGEGPARGRLDVGGVVGRAHADGVAAVGREARRRERVRPVAGGEGGRVPDLARAREGAGAPVVARALADRDLDRRDAGGCVRVRAAEADVRSPRSSRRCCRRRPRRGRSSSSSGRPCRPSRCSSRPSRPCCRRRRSRARRRCGCRRLRGLA